MNPEFWLARWREGRIGFHDAHPNPFLVAHADKLGPPPRRVFVPLCGKARDMAHLASLGHRVVGVELAKIAVEAFFEESGVVPARSVRGKLEVLAAEGIELLVGDVFDVGARDGAPFDAAYDRAALVALPRETRVRYARHVISLLAPSAKTLLVTFDYDASKMSGPPFAIADDEVAELYGASCTIERLGDRDVTNERPRFREVGLDRVTETAWLLTKNAT